MEAITTECQCDLCLSIRGSQKGGGITQKRLKEVLDYNPDTGLFLWIRPGSGRVVGDEAGTYDANGYIKIGIDREYYYAHRLAILYTDGYLPELTVDHKDRIPWHNWRDNLREASMQCQSRNRGMNSRNTTGVKGVTWSERDKRWYAHIAVDGKLSYLGIFDNLLEAVYARFAAEQCLGFQDCDLNSSAKLFINAAVSVGHR